MNKNKFVFLRSFVVLPLLGTMLTGTSGFGVATAFQGAFLQANTVQAAPSPEDIARAQHAAKIDQFFAERNMPLAGEGEELAKVAEENGLDWSLLAAIAARESSGGKDACDKYPTNVFGWDSCKTGWKTVGDAIEAIGSNLGGKVARTADYYKKCKDTKCILNTYNPPYIIHNYTKEVLGIMDAIKKEPLPSNAVAVQNTASVES